MKIKTLFSAALLFAVPCCFAETPLYPVQWFNEVESNIAIFNYSKPLLKISSPKDFKLLMNKPCNADEDCGIPYAVKEGQKKTAMTCDEFLAITDSQFPEIREDAQRLASYKTVCMGFDALGNAQPAKLSYLGKFQLNKATILAFPAAMAVCSELPDCKQAHGYKTLGEALKRRISGDGEKIDFHNFKQKDARHASYSTYLINRKFSLLALGDFNGDGIEDAMIGVEDTGGREYYSGLYLLTKKSKAAPFELLKGYRRGD